MFSKTDPEEISENLVNGLKEITDLIISKKSVQERKKGVFYWSTPLPRVREGEIKYFSAFSQQLAAQMRAG